MSFTQLKMKVHVPLCFSPCDGEDSFNNVGCNIRLLAIVPFFNQLSDLAVQSGSARDHPDMKLCEGNSLLQLRAGSDQLITLSCYLELTP